MFLAWNEIRKNSKKFILIISIIVLISYLVFSLFSLAYGLATNNRTAVDLWESENIVLSRGSNSNLMISIVDYDVMEQFTDHEVSPVNISRTSCYKNGIEDEDHIVDIALIGIDYTSRICPELVEGRFPEDLYEVMVSIDMKEEEGIELGDTLELTQTYRVFTVVGFSEPAKFNISPVVYTDLFMNSPGMRVMKPADNVDAESGPTPDMPKRINGIIIHDKFDEELDEELDIITVDEFINEIPGYFAQVLTFGLMIGSLVIISAIILGVFLYIITLQKKMTFGVMKIQGISNSYISRSVIFQTFILVLFGIIVGVSLTYLTGFLLPSAVPFKTSAVYFFLIAAIMILTSLLGAIFSVISVSKIDPIEVLE